MDLVELKIAILLNFGSDFLCIHGSHYFMIILLLTKLKICMKGRANNEISSNRK